KVYIFEVFFIQSNSFGKFIFMKKNKICFFDRTNNKELRKSLFNLFFIVFNCPFVDHKLYQKKHFIYKMNLEGLFVFLNVQVIYKINRKMYSKSSRSSTSQIQQSHDRKTKKNRSNTLMQRITGKLYSSFSSFPDDPRKAHFWLHMAHQKEHLQPCLGGMLGVRLICFGDNKTKTKEEETWYLGIWSWESQKYEVMNCQWYWTCSQVILIALKQKGVIHI
ncbi:hypothetical protein RFI_33041, partial [Reticulomyxa filosa]